MCPLEKLFRKESPMGEWEEIPVRSFAPAVKAGIVEQVAGMLSPSLAQVIPLVSLEESVSLANYAESVFGYSSN
tara:strand:- start:137 stop:358 length:222 start_codon:yes stop_codon:yes gene_type:complete